MRIYESTIMHPKEQHVNRNIQMVCIHLSLIFLSKVTHVQVPVVSFGEYQIWCFQVVSGRRYSFSQVLFDEFIPWQEQLQSYVRFKFSTDQDIWFSDSFLNLWQRFEKNLRATWDLTNAHKFWPTIRLGTIECFHMCCFVYRFLGSWLYLIEWGRNKSHVGLIFSRQGMWTLPAFLKLEWRWMKSPLEGWWNIVTINSDLMQKNPGMKWTSDWWGVGVQCDANASRALQARRKFERSNGQCKNAHKRV